jgi:hypothetical protein
MYWIGECLDAQDETEEALAIFNQVLEEYPASDKPPAQPKKGPLSQARRQGAGRAQPAVRGLQRHRATREADLARSGALC